MNERYFITATMRAYPRVRATTPATTASNHLGGAATMPGARRKAKTGLLRLRADSERDVKVQIRDVEQDSNVIETIE